jgi:hypothetical protein
MFADAPNFEIESIAAGKFFVFDNCVENAGHINFITTRKY